jgi:hypothetical protein
MKFKTMMIIKAVVCLCFGVLILAVPVFAYQFFLGLNLDPAGIFTAREYGVSLIGILLITWFARNADESEARWAITLALCVYDALGFVLSLLGEITGLLGPMGWSIVVLYLFLAIGFGYFLIKSPLPVTSARAM